MSKFFALFLVVCLSSSAIIAQTNLKLPTLTQLETYARTIKTNIAFKPIAKQWGFAFETKEDADGDTDYVYVRRTKVSTLVYTERWVFTEVINGNNFIRLSTTQNLKVLYLPAIQKKYKSADCIDVSSDNNELHTCFENKSYFIRLIDQSTQLDDGSKGNSYTISIFKLYE